MWILPKQLHTSAFVPDTEALISDLAEQSQACAQSLLVRSKVSPARTWSLKWKRDSWTQLLSGRILKPSHGPSFTAAWTSSLAATRASHLAQPASDSAPKTHDTSGPTYQPELLQCDQVAVSLKTSRDISRWGCPTLSKTWADWVTERRGAYSARVKLARSTRGSGSLFWPSVVASEVRQGFQDRSRGMKGSQESLTTAVVKDAANWPTPAEQDGKQGGITPFQAKGGNHTNLLHIAAIKSTHGQAAPASSSSLGSRQGLSWPTPQTMDTLPVRPVEEFAETNKTRGGRKNRKALSNLREAVHSPVYQASSSLLGSSQAKETWWTPQVQDSKHSGTNPTANGERDLLVNQVNWATPQAHDAQGPKTPEQIAAMRAKGYGVKNLNEQACWGTPTARDHKSGRGNEDRQYKELTPMVERQQSGKLNPRWVETLMGLPIGWTMPSCTSPQTIAPMSCDSLAMELCRLPQSEPSEFFLAS
jgi:hypothetical protein